MVQLMTKSPSASVAIPGEDPARVIVSGPTQKIEPVGPGVIDLTVTAISPPAAPSADAQPAGKEFLEPNTYLQSDDARVRACADEAVGSETDPWKAACLMESWVHTNLKEKNFSTLLASAAEVARDLQGDCTEHAVLVAAMARAKKIPSRVAVGLGMTTVYNLSTGTRGWVNAGLPLAYDELSVAV